MLHKVLCIGKNGREVVTWYIQKGTNILMGALVGTQIAASLDSPFEGYPEWWLGLNSLAAQGNPPHLHRKAPHSEILDNNFSDVPSSLSSLHMGQFHEVP